jgi:hypothetical protein
MRDTAKVSHYRLGEIRIRHLNWKRHSFNRDCLFPTATVVEQAELVVRRGLVSWHLRHYASAIRPAMK